MYIYSAKKLTPGTSLNTDLSKTDPFNFDGSTETGNLGITGTLPIEHGGTGATSRTEALTALQAGGSGATDANIVASGTYVLTTDTASNLPPEAGYYLLVVFRYHTSDLACGQIAINLGSNTFYHRVYVTGVWRKWESPYSFSKNNSQTKLYSGSCTAGNEITVNNCSTYTLILVEVECGQFRATKVILPDMYGYWTSVALPNNTHVTLQVTSGVTSTSWKFYNDTTTSSGGKIIGVYGLMQNFYY